MASRFDEEEPSGMPPMEFPPEATKTRPKVVKKPNGEHQKDEIAIPIGESIHSLIERDIPRPAMLCDPWATEGINLIVGRPKLGKTTLARQKMVAASIAGDYLDSKFPQAVKCAFLSLEEGELLCRSKFMECGFPEEALASIQSFFEWPRGDMGVNLLDRYLAANPEVKYVCIDSLTRFRVIPDVRTPAFMADYEAVNQLHEMSKKHPGVCIDIVHHARKSKSDDPMDDVSGTYGLTAAADCITVLRNHAEGVVMYVYSRLWSREENQYSLKRSGRRTWDLIGVHLDITDEQKEAFRFISDGGISGASGKELADKIGITPQSAWGRIDGLIEKGMVVKRFGRVYKK